MRVIQLIVDCNVLSTAPIKRGPKGSCQIQVDGPPVITRSLNVAKGQNGVHLMSHRKLGDQTGGV